MYPEDQGGSYGSEDHLECMESSRWAVNLYFVCFDDAETVMLDIPLMALPPCHMMCQFYVHLPPPSTPTAKPKLSCLMYQRSADLGLGIPFNIASYALLTQMMVHVTNTEAQELIIQLGDAHVYRDHVEALEAQLRREPRSFPTVRWVREVEDIDSLTSEDFVVEGYDPHPSIAMKMSV